MLFLEKRNKFYKTTLSRNVCFSIVFVRHTINSKGTNILIIMIIVMIWHLASWSQNMMCIKPELIVCCSFKIYKMKTESWLESVLQGSLTSVCHLYTWLNKKLILYVLRFEVLQFDHLNAHYTKCIPFLNLYSFTDVSVVKKYGMYYFLYSMGFTSSLQCAFSNYKLRWIYIIVQLKL